MLSSLSPSSIDMCTGPCVRKRNYYIVFHSLDGNKPVKLIYWQRQYDWLLQAIHNSSDLNKDNLVGVTLMPTVFGGGFPDEGDSKVRLRTFIRSQ